MLDYIYNSCYETANSLGNWQDINKNDIANLYLDNRHTEKGNLYGAALLCKYWYKVGLIWKSSKNSMSQEDCYEIVWDGIEKAIDYAPWRNPENTLYEDPNGPDKAINVCIDSIRKIYYTFSNRDKRKVNYGSNSFSLDGFAEDWDNFAGDLLGYYEGEYYTDMSIFHICSLINTFIKTGKLAEAIIVDNICFNDSVCKSSVEKDSAVMFNERKFISEIHRLDVDNYSRYFAKKYNVKESKVKETFTKINGLSLNLTHKLIDKTLYMIRNLDRYKYVY